ncbi:MAG: hypothetical protein ACYDAC_00995 [Candidatus Dormibacteria bacterium]
MAEVYDNCGASTYAAAASILDDRAMAEDVVFEAHMCLWRRPAEALRHHHTVQSYLVDLARRAARERRPPTPPADPVGAPLRLVRHHR